MDLPQHPEGFVRAWLEAFNRRDWEAYAACFAEDVTYLTPGRDEPLVSRAAHVDQDQRSAGSLTLEPTLVMPCHDGRHIAVEGLAHLEGRTSRWVTVLEIRRGLIAAERLYFDTAAS